MQREAPVIEDIRNLRAGSTRDRRPRDRNKPVAETRTSVARRVAVAAAVVILCGCAGSRVADTRVEPSEYCVPASELRDWRPLDELNVILFATGSRAYRVELAWPATGLMGDVMIGVYDRDGWICPDDAVIVDGATPEVVPIRWMKLLSDEELEDLEMRYATTGDEPAVIHVVDRLPRGSGRFSRQ
jgi:hypothetical protein